MNKLRKFLFLSKSRPFMQFICSVLKPFGDLSTPEKQQSIATHGKKSKSYVPFFYENLNKYQCENVSVESLLNRHLSILPFKPYFEQLYKICKIFNRLDFLIENFERLPTTNLRNQLKSILNDAGCLTTQTPATSTLGTDEQLQINELIIDAVNKLDGFNDNR